MFNSNSQKAKNTSLLLQAVVIILQAVNESNQHGGDPNIIPGYEHPEHQIIDKDVFSPPPDTAPGEPLCWYDVVKKQKKWAHNNCNKECIALTERTDIIFDHYGAKTLRDPERGDQPTTLLESYVRSLRRYCHGFVRGRCQNFGNWQWWIPQTSICRCEALDFNFYSFACRNYMTYTREVVNTRIAVQNWFDGVDLQATAAHAGEIKRIRSTHRPEVTGETESRRKKHTEPEQRKRKPGHYTEKKD